MKRLTKLFGCLLITATLTSISCSKRDKVSPPPVYPSPPVNPLSGKEFQFDSLKWEYNDNIDIVEVYIANRPDLFSNLLSFEVFLKPDTSSAWVPVVRNVADPQFSGFIYGTGATNLAIWPIPNDFSFFGKTASIKIKFK